MTTSIYFLLLTILAPLTRYFFEESKNTALLFFIIMVLIIARKFKLTKELKKSQKQKLKFNPNKPFQLTFKTISSLAAITTLSLILIYICLNFYYYSNNNVFFNTTYILYTWLLIVILSLYAFSKNTVLTTSLRLKAKKTAIIDLSIISLISLLPRIYKLSSIPVGIANDEFSDINKATVVIENFSKVDFFANGHLEVPHIFPYEISFFLMLLPNDPILAARLVNALTGFFVPIVFYVLLKHLVTRKTAFYAALFLAASTLSIDLSRYIYNFQINTLMGLLAILFTIKACNKRLPRLAIWSAFFTCINFIVGYVGVILAATIPVILLLYLKKRLINIKFTFLFSAIFLIFLSIFFVPRMFYIIDSFHQLKTRYISNNATYAIEKKEENIISTYSKTISKTFDYLIYLPTGLSNRYRDISISFIEGMLLIVGFAVCIVNIRKKSVILMFFILLITFIPVILSDHIKFYRLVTFLPAFYFIFAVGFIFLMKHLSVFLKLKKHSSSIIVLIFAALISFNNASSYFKEQASNKNFWDAQDMGKRALYGRIVKSLLAEGHEIYSEEQIIASGSLGGLIYPYKTENIHMIKDYHSIPLQKNSFNKEKITFFFNVSHTDQFRSNSTTIISQLKNYYPLGNEQVYYDPNGYPAAILYTVKSKDIINTQNLKTIKNLSSGTFSISKSQQYKISLQQCTEVNQLTINNQTININREDCSFSTFLHRGQHFIKISYENQAPQKTILFWENENGEQESIPEYHFNIFTPQKTTLVGKYYDNEKCTGTPVFTRNDLEISLSDNKSYSYTNDEGFSRIKCITWSGIIKTEPESTHLKFGTNNAFSLNTNNSNYINKFSPENSYKVDYFNIPITKHEQEIKITYFSTKQPPYLIIYTDNKHSKEEVLSINNFL